MGNKEIVLKSVDAVVMKNSEFEVTPWSGDEKDWNPETHDIYKNFIGKTCQSVQISDQKDLYKTGGVKGTFDHIPFGTRGKIKIVFFPENQSKNPS